jgi:hypothetical protein
MTKSILGVLTAFAVAAGAARFAYSINADQSLGTSDAAWSQDRIGFVAWNNQKWTAWIRDNSFELDPENTGSWSRHSNSSIAFIDWNNEPWQAKVDGDSFLLAQKGNWQGDIQRSEAIRYTDWSGDNQIRTIAEIRR